MEKYKILKMKKILLVCNAGMSTSMLAKKMQEFSDANSLDFEIEALPLDQGRSKISEVDVVLIGPQIKYTKDDLQKLFPNIPMEVVPVQAYGLMDGKSIIELVQKLLK